MLTMACGLATAADPPAKSAATLPALLAEGIKVKVPGLSNLSSYFGFEKDATYGKSKSTGSYSNPLPANQIATPPTVADAIIKTNKTNVAKTPKIVGPGYTQIGSLFKVKLDRPETQLNLYEDSNYAIYAESGKFRIANIPDDFLVEIENAAVCSG